MTEHIRIDIEYPNANWARKGVTDAWQELFLLAEVHEDIKVMQTKVEPDTLTLENAEDAIFRVVDDVRALVESSTPFGFAQNLIDLQNSASNLATWHRGYNYNTGRIIGQEGD